MGVGGLANRGNLAASLEPWGRRIDLLESAPACGCFRLVDGADASAVASNGSCEPETEREFSEQARAV